MKLLFVLSTFMGAFLMGQNLESARLFEREGAYFEAYQQYEEVYEKSEVKDVKILQKLIQCAYYANRLDLAQKWNQKLDPNLRLRENMMAIRNALSSIENDQSFNFLSPYPGDWNHQIIDLNTVWGTDDLLLIKTKDGFIYNQEVEDIKWSRLLQVLNQYEIPDAPTFLNENTIIVSFGKQVQVPYQSFEKKQLEIESNQLKYITYDGNKWSLSGALNFISYGKTYRYPFFDPGSKRLFFALKTDELNASFDIYSVIQNEEGAWSKPIDMGSNVNSEYHERFPSVYKDEVYYSSFKNKNKIGNIDLYTFNMKDMTESINAGDTINSAYHDLKYIETANHYYVLSNDSKNNENILLYQEIKIEEEVIVDIPDVVEDYDTVLLGSIYFELNTTKIDDLKPVDDIIADIPENTESIVIIGHADHTGNAIKNKSIASKRSKFIAQAFSKEGLGLHSHHHGDQASKDHCAEQCNEDQHNQFRRVDVFAVVLTPAQKMQ